MAGRRVRQTAALLASLGLAPSLGAQTLPSEPIALADGRVTVSGDVSASFGSRDPGFFDYTDYEHSALRLLRIDVSAAAKAGPHLSLLGEVRTENLGNVRTYALYARIRPWTQRDFDIQGFDRDCGAAESQRGNQEAWDKNASKTRRTPGPDSKIELHDVKHLPRRSAHNKRLGWPLTRRM